jgi:flagellar biosynthesis/type III secretory pathway protein FliH
MRLSDAFEKVEGYEDVNLELIVEFRNINKGHNEELVKKCKPLDGYVKFVDIVRGKEAELRKAAPDTDRGIILEQAIAYGVTYCKEHNILREFFDELSMEEQKMLATEWKLEEALQVRWEEGWEEGWDKGREEGWDKGREEGWDKGREEGWDKGLEEGIEKERKWIMSLLAQGKSANELKQIIETAPIPTGKSGIGN